MIPKLGGKTTTVLTYYFSTGKCANTEAEASHTASAVFLKVDDENIIACSTKYYFDTLASVVGWWKSMSCARTGSHPNRFHSMRHAKHKASSRRIGLA